MSQFSDITKGLSFKDYLELPELNWSALKHILKTPKHFSAALSADLETTLDQRIGSLAHSYILEGKVPEYIIRPAHNPLDPEDKWHGNKKWCKAWTAAQNVPVLTPDESRREIAICNAVADSRDARHYLSQLPEREITVQAEYRGVRLKCRPDAAVFKVDNYALILDLKKAQDVSPTGFGTAVARYEYLGAMGLYRRVVATALDIPLSSVAFAWLAVEDSDAADVVLYEPTAEWYAIGDERFELALSRFITARDADQWPGYAALAEPGKHLSPVLPGWWLKGHEQVRLGLPAPTLDLDDSTLELMEATAP